MSDEESERQRLHSGAPFWLLNSGLDELDSLELHDERKETRADVAIIGAGITGALLADRLTQGGMNVTVYDRRAPGYGSTSASTALLLYDIDVELKALIKLVGENDAVRAYQLGVDAIAHLETLCTQLGDCNFALRPSVYLASRKQHRRQLEAEYEIRARANLPVTWCEADAVFDHYGFQSFGAIKTAWAAMVDPVSLTRALLRRAVAHGAQLRTRTTVNDVVSTESGLELTTNRGNFRADRVIYAAGYEVPAALREHRVKLHSSYALVTEPLESLGKWNDQCMVWETARPYCYMRASHDSRVMIGGFDVPFRNPDWRDRLMPDRTRRLEKRLQELLPDVVACTAYAWAGTFGETPDGLPYIGTLDSHPRIAYALGYGGNGITFGVMAADILADWIAGRANDDAHIFRLNR